MIALVATMPALPAEPPATTVERIEITGTQIRRTAADQGALPVTTLTREEIERTGFTDAAQLLEKLPFTGGHGYGPALSIGDAARSGLAATSLRGLGYTRTLVLLNGRRLAPYSFGGSGIDLGQLPLSALERIEVLRDGASSIYGADAVAGVINFITRKDYRGLEVAGEHAQPDAPGGAWSRANATLGFGDLDRDRYNAFVNLDWQRYARVMARDRRYASTGARPDLFPDPTDYRLSGNAIPANALSADGSTRFANPAYPGCVPPRSLNVRDDGFCYYDYANAIDILSPSERASVLARGTWGVAPDHALFGELAWSRVEHEFAVAESPSVTVGKPPFLYPAGGKYTPQPILDLGYAGDLWLAWRSVDGGRRKETVTSGSARLLLGVEGIVAGWAYDAALLHARSDNDDEYTDGWFHDARMREALATGKVNPFGPNDEEGQALLEAAKIRGEMRSSKFVHSGLDARASRELAPMRGGPFALAIGAACWTERYHDGFAAFASGGDIVAGGGSRASVTGDRDVRAVFVEAVAPFSRGWEAQFALRHDRYSDFGATTNPKLGLRWQPLANVLLRAAWGTGFRAPSLDDLYRPASLTFTGGHYNDPYYDASVGCESNPNPAYCRTQLAARNSGNRDLGAETSRQWTIGGVWDLTQDFSVGVDYFDIRIDDAIGFVSGDDVITDWLAQRTGPTTSASVLAERVVREPATGYLGYLDASYLNLGEQRTAGFDANAMARLDAGNAGRFTVNWAGTYFTRATERALPGDPSRSVLGRYATFGPSIRFKQAWDLGWTRGAWEAAAQVYWQQRYRDDSGRRTVASYATLDIQGTWKGVRNLVLTAGVRNVLDRDPPASDQDDYFQVGYDPTYADVRGRTYYLRARYKFR